MNKEAYGNGGAGTSYTEEIDMYSPTLCNAHRQGVEQCGVWLRRTPRPPGSGGGVNNWGASGVFTILLRLGL